MRFRDFPGGSDGKVSAIQKSFRKHSESLDCCEWHQAQDTSSTHTGKVRRLCALKQHISVFMGLHCGCSLCYCMNYSTQASLSFTMSPSLLKLMSIESVMPSNHLILCCPLLLLPSIFPGIRVFSNELAVCIMWSEHWSFSFSIIPFNEYSGLISFRMDWLDLLAVQGTLKSLFQHHSSKASIFRAQPSFWSNSHIVHDYWDVALTKGTFVGLPWHLSKSLTQMQRDSGWQY